MRPSSAGDYRSHLIVAHHHDRYDFVLTPDDWFREDRSLLPGALVKSSPIPIPMGSSGNRWKGLYNAALFENDRSRIVQRIAEAQAAIVARRQLLLMSRSYAKERQALDTALLSLQALANCFATTPRQVGQVRDASVRSGNIRAA
jgi:hypothetical protein